MPRDCTVGRRVVVARGWTVPVCTGTQYMQKTNNNVPQQRANSQKKKSVSSPVPGGKSVVGAAYPAARSANIKGDIDVSHKEYVASLTGTSVPFLMLGNSAFVPGYDINPGNTLLFPWLSKIAGGFEKFRFERLTFELVPHNPTTAAGAVFMAVDYDYDDAVPTDPADLMINRGAVAGDVWTPKELKVDVPRMNEGLPWRFVESSGRSNSGSRLSYGGYAMVAIQGCAAAVTFDLYVAYSVRFSLPAIHHTISESNVWDYTGTLTAGDFCPFATLPKVGGAIAVKLVSDTPITAYCQPTDQVYDLGAGSRAGTLTFGAYPQTVGATPASFAADTTSSAVLYDSNGTVLTTNLTPFLSTPGFWQGAQNVAEWATAGKPGKTMWTLALDLVRDLYPTARYLAPYLQSIAGRVLAGTMLYAKHVEL